MEYKHMKQVMTNQPHQAEICHLFYHL